MVPAPGSKNGLSLVTTSAGFITNSTGTANDYASIVASSLANLWDHLLSRLFRSSNVGLLLDFFLLGFGDSSGLFFLPAGVSSVVEVRPPSTCPNCLTSEGSMSVGIRNRGGSNRLLLLLFFFPGSVGSGGQLLSLFRHKSLTNSTVLLLNTRIVFHPLISASSLIHVAIQQSHNVP